MLDEQTGIVELLKKRIRDDGHALRANETRTRAVLIDPLLQMLDWDISDPKAVTLEYEVPGGRADYALLGPDFKPVAVIEAKRLGESLESHLRQMLAYAVMTGIPFAGLTNGDTWQIYSVFERTSLSEKLKLNISVANDPSHECVLKLLWLWRPNLSSGKPVTPEPPDIGESKDADPPRTQPQGGWISLLDFAAPTNGKPGKPPQYIKFPDGTQCAVSYWYELLVHTAEWLCKEGLLTRSDMPVPANKQSSIISTTPKHHRDGRKFIRPKPVAGTSFVVEANLSAKQIVDRSRVLLERFGRGPDTARVRIDRQLPGER